MPLEISYWTASRYNPNVPGAPISAESRALTSTSAQSGATPPNAVFIKINATEVARFGYGTNPTASATSAWLGQGEVLWMDAIPGNKVAGITS